MEAFDACYRTYFGRSTENSSLPTTWTGGVSQRIWYGSSFLFIKTILKADGTYSYAIVKSNVSGSSRTTIATSTKIIDNALWSRDGTGVIFSTYPLTTPGVFSINYVNADGTGRKIIASDGNSAGNLSTLDLISW